MEKTINKILHLEGSCLYSKKNTKLVFYPLNAFSGIYINNIKIGIENIVETNKYYTTISNIKLTEHLLSALYFLGINNLYIECNNNEIPIMDGASNLFIELFKNNIFEFDYKSDIFKLNNKIIYNVYESENKDMNHEASERFIEIEKGDFEINCNINFPYCGNQTFKLKNIQDYDEEISSYKTHMNIEFYNYCVKEHCLNQNVSDSVLIYDNNSIFVGDELARHKILDIIGDIQLCNVRIEGKINSFRSGHKIHHEFCKLLYDEYKIFKKNSTHIEIICKKDVDDLIDKYELKPYYNLNHFSFDLNLYEKFQLIMENNYVYIFTERPYDHWSPLFVLTNNPNEDSNYLPFVIKQKKNCILYKIDDKIRDINSNIRYYWKSKCNLEDYLKFRDNISKRKHFPSSKTYKEYINMYQNYYIELENFTFEKFEKYYDELKRPEHKPAKEIPIPNINKNLIKLAYLKHNDNVLFVAAIVDTGSSVSVLNLASKLDNLHNNLGTGFLACFKLFEHFCKLNYDSFDVCISRMYGCYKNKLCIERYQFNELIDY
jgi:UDP-3-O-[3-hydroxymyristoyl] N-acetylglucosamine deacetylase